MAFMVVGGWCLGQESLCVGFARLHFPLVPQEGAPWPHQLSYLRAQMWDRSWEGCGGI